MEGRRDDEVTLKVEYAKRAPFCFKCTGFLAPTILWKIRFRGVEQSHTWGRTTRQKPLCRELTPLKFLHAQQSKNQKLVRLAVWANVAHVIPGMSEGRGLKRREGTRPRYQQQMGEQKTEICWHRNQITVESKNSTRCSYLRTLAPSSNSSTSLTKNKPKDPLIKAIRPLKRNGTHHHPSRVTKSPACPKSD